MSAITKEYLLSLQSFRTEEEYRSSSSLNYSTLKELDNGPRCLIADRTEYSGDAIIIGIYVDAWFTDKDKLKDLFELEKTKTVLAGTLKELGEELAAAEIYEPSRETVLSIIRDMGLWDSIKNDNKVWARVKPELFEYLKEASEKTTKIVLTNDQLLKAAQAINNISRNDEAMKLISESEDEIVIDQFKWEFEHYTHADKKHAFKVMYDKLKFNTKTKKITGIDIKTGAKPAHLFGDSIFNYRYDIQGILYLYGMMALKNQYFPDWQCCMPEDFKFVYGPKLDSARPIIVSLDADFIKRNGSKFEYNGKAVPGIWTLIADAGWYLENQEFQDHRILVETGGLVKISQLI